LFPVTANSAFTDYLFFTSVDAGQTAELGILGENGVLVNTVTITQTDLGAAAPEPAAWSLMIVAGLIGMEAKRRRLL
jgi:hypothetical protein